LYYISARAGGRALTRFSEKQQARVKNLIEQYGVLSVLVASLLPPPFPFKLFVVSAGVFRLSVLRFALAVTGGRAVRYLLEAYLAARYGQQAEELFARYYPWIVACLAALVILFFVGRKLWRKRSNGDARNLGAGRDTPKP
ncbi:MAG TPA: hypothetical protein VF507_01400, partial [Pyrinomonadaceae bacterium]